jgi:hypothetical protein
MIRISTLALMNVITLAKSYGDVISGRQLQNLDPEAEMEAVAEKEDEMERERPTGKKAIPYFMEYFASISSADGKISE